MKVIMFHKRTYNNQQPTVLNKANSSYRKLEKEMNKPPSDYEQIKKLIEDNENNIKSYDNKKQKIV